MTRISPALVEVALAGSPHPLAAELLARLRSGESPTAKATRPIPRTEALRVYREKAGKGDRGGVRTEGYPELLQALALPIHDLLVIHGVTYPDAVYLVFTDPDRTECIALLRKRRAPRQAP